MVSSFFYASETRTIMKGNKKGGDYYVKARTIRSFGRSDYWYA